MIVDEITELWEQRPFVPFEIAMADGSVHVIENPKWMLMSDDGKIVVYVKRTGPSHKLATHLMTRVLEINTAQPPGAA